jgi:hypothetical protein
MFRAIWRRVIVLMIVTAIVVFSVPLPQAIDAQDGNERLERLIQFGGAIHAAIFDGTDALVAEGDSIVRIPLIGTQAYQPSERLSLNYGVITDLLQTSQALYALTNSHILILDAAGRSVLSAIDGGGEHLTHSGDILAVETSEAGIRLYDILPTSELRLQSQIPISSQLGGSTFLNQDLLAIADQSAGLRILNIEDPMHPQSVSAIQGITPVEDVASFAQWVYVTNQHRVYIVNTSNPQQPTVIGHYAPIHDVQDIERFGPYLLMADGVDGLKAYEQTQVDQIPRYLNSQIAAPAYHIAIDPTQQWMVSTHQDGIRFYDATQLPRFQRLSFLPLWSPPTGIHFIFGQALALVPVGSGGAAIVDFSNPESPRVAAALSFSGPVQEILAHPIYTNLLYLTLGDGQLLTIMIDPNNPENTTVFSEISLSGQPDELDIDPDGRILAVATGRSGLNFYTLFPDPAQPRLIAEAAANSTQTAGITQIEYAGDRLWVALNGQTLQLFGIHNRTLRLLDVTAVEGKYLTVDEEGTISISGQNHLETLSIDRNRLRRYPTYYAPTAYQDVQAVLGQVILANNSPEASLLVLDVGNPTGPTELRSISSPIPIEKFTLNGDDILLTHPVAGMAHIRFPLLMSAQIDHQPQVAGIYSPAMLMGHFRLGQNNKLLAVGQRSVQWDMTDLSLSEMGYQPIMDGVMLRDGVVFLDENFSPVRVDGIGQRVVQNPALHGLWLASDGQNVWLLNYQGQLYTLDSTTLDMIQPMFTIEMNSASMAMLYTDGDLLLGTYAGELWAFNPSTQSLIRLFETNSPILSLSDFPDTSGQILLTTQAGDLWWLDLSDPEAVQTIARYQTSSAILASDADSTGQWIAIGTETCGVQVLAAHSPQDGLTVYAQHPDTPITDVHFVGNRIFALTAGIPTLYQFNPDGNPLRPEIPHHPIPRSMSEVSSPVQMLMWQSAVSSCLSVDYEVWIDGQLMGTTQSPQWILPSPIDHDFRWQVISIDAYGNRAASTEWQVYAPVSGWYASPSSVDNMHRLRQTQTHPVAPPIWLFGLVLAGMGLIGLTTLVRRLFPKRT